MRIATWNVNSLRARKERVASWLQRSDVDVLLLQETKVTDAGFPGQLFADLGYQVAHHGLSQWNGVAIASRVGLSDVRIGVPGLPEFDGQSEARSIGAVCGGIGVWSLYIPNGRVIDDPHYHYKLAWLAALRQHVEAELAEPGARLLIGGDFNIAPTDEDIWSVEYYRGQTHVTPPERAAFQALLDAGLIDLVRPYTPGPGVYTYWDYTQLSFQKRRGMRIDFLLGSPAVGELTTRAIIDREERKGKGASDHAPVAIELGEAP